MENIAVDTNLSPGNIIQSVEVLNMHKSHEYDFARTQDSLDTIDNQRQATLMSQASPMD